jgi:hypothetical protein
MSRRRLAISFAVMCATLVFPRQARAGLADIIWEMSGPQMVGETVRCRFPLHGGKVQCRVSLEADKTKTPDTERVWFTLEAGGYVSTGVNHGGTNYEAGNIWAIAVEPMAEFLYEGDIKEAYRKHSGVGAAYFGVGGVISRYFVKGATPGFMQFGIKVRPVAIAFSGWAVEYNLRLYPKGFTPYQFGFGAPTDRKFEIVPSVSVSIPYHLWNLF